MEEQDDGDNSNSKDPYLELEYKECLTTIRFTSGVRFSFFTAFITLFGILIGAYEYVWTSKEEVFGLLKSYLLTAVSFFGLLTGFIAWIIERRNAATLGTCRYHALDIEREMRPLPKGRVRLQQRLATPETREKVFFGVAATHGIAISIAYFIILVIWVGLFIYSFYKIRTS